MVVTGVECGGLGGNGGRAVARNARKDGGEEMEVLIGGQRGET